MSPAYQQTSYYSKFLVWFIVNLTVALTPLGAEELDLSKAKLGTEPDSLTVIDGEFLAVELEGTERGLEVSTTPLVEAGAQFGTTIKGQAKVSADFLASRQGRSFPRFGIGLHGLSGMRLRLVPSSRTIELLYKEEVVAQQKFEANTWPWESGEPVRMELTVRPSDAEGSYRVQGRIWKPTLAKDSGRPSAPQITKQISLRTVRGKASIWATPYSGTPVVISRIIAAPTNEPIPAK